MSFLVLSRQDFKLLQGQNEDLLWMEDKSEEDAGIYTCTCTWEHNHRVYKSSGSRRFKPESERTSSSGTGNLKGVQENTIL